MTSYASTESLSKSSSTSDLTDMTDVPSDNDSVCEEITTATSLEDSNRLREQLQNDEVVSGNQRRVRFSFVQIREFDILTEREGSRPSYKSLDSTVTYIDTESDIETHLSEKKQRRKEKYLQMIQYQINRVESQKDGQKNLNKVVDEKKGFRSKVLRPMWKGFLEAASRSPMIMPMPGY